MAQMCGEYQQERWGSGKNKMLDVCSMENCTDVDDRELVVTQAQIRRSYPLDRVNGNSKKCSVFFVFPLHKVYVLNGFLISEFIVASLYQTYSEY